MKLLLADSIGRAMSLHLGADWHVECFPLMSLVEFASEEYGTGFYTSEERYTSAVVIMGINDVKRGFSLNGMCAAQASIRVQSAVPVTFIAVNREVTSLDEFSISLETLNDGMHLTEKSKKELTTFILSQRKAFPSTPPKNHTSCSFS